MPKRVNSFYVSAPTHLIVLNLKEKNSSKNMAQAADFLNRVAVVWVSDDEGAQYYQVANDPAFPRQNPRGAPIDAQSGKLVVVVAGGAAPAFAPTVHFNDALARKVFFSAADGPALVQAILGSSALLMKTRRPFMLCPEETKSKTTHVLFLTFFFFVLS